MPAGKGEQLCLSPKLVKLVVLLRGLGCGNVLIIGTDDDGKRQALQELVGSTRGQVIREAAGLEDEVRGAKCRLRQPPAHGGGALRKAQYGDVHIGRALRQYGSGQLV